MVELGCQDTDRVRGNEKEVLGGLCSWVGLILAALGMDKEKCDNVGCISCWFGALKGAPRITDG